MMAVFLALRQFLPDLRGYHVLVRIDNILVVAEINHQEGPCLRPLFRLVQKILLWMDGKLLSLRAIYIPGHPRRGYAHY